MANSAQGKHETSQGPGLLTALAAQMKVDFLVNDNGDIAVLHDQPLSATLQWLEYDDDSHQLLFVYDTGGIQELGMVLPREVRELILRAGEALIVHIRKQGGNLSMRVPVIVREAVFH